MPDVTFSRPERRFEGVTVVGVDEHVWRHTRRGDKYVTVIIDLTPITNGTGPSRLLDVVEARSKHAFKSWLAARDKAALHERGCSAGLNPPASSSDRAM